MAAVVFTNVWRGIPFFAIMLLAGLQSVPDELYEAAHVDGAGVLARFWHITLPLLRPIIVVATATRIIWTFNYADLIFVMTGGGPANATQITSTYTLLQAYSSLDFGYAGALSVVLLLVMLAFTAALSPRHQGRRGDRTERAPRLEGSCRAAAGRPGGLDRPRDCSPRLRSARSSGCCSPR